MRKNYIILLFVLGFISTHAQDSLYTRKVINTLCSKQFAGRGYIKNGLDVSAKYIVSELKKFKTTPLFNTGYYQWFDFNVNTFPGNMNVTVNGKILKPGIDFIISPESVGLKGKFNVEKKDSVTYIGSSEPPIVLSLKRKLTFSVSTECANYCAIELLNNNTFNDIKTVEVTIENKLLNKYICKNICAYINGKDEKNDTVIMLTAHYDHLGGMGSKTYFPGANDNASGICELLSLARYYAQHPQPYTMAFICFSGEEAGLLGSKYFTENPLIPLSNIRFLLNMDILGTGEEGITVVNATVYPKEFAMIKQVNED